MPGLAKSNFFVCYENDQIAVQAIRLLHERGYEAYPLEEGLAPPDGAVFLFSCKANFASKFLATKPEQYERRGIVPPDTAKGALQFLAIQRTDTGRPYGKFREANFASALEIFVGYIAPKKPKAKRNRWAESRQRRLEERNYL